jgi:hypothetical protein
MPEIMKTGDKRIDFILENYAKVLDLQECIRLTENEYPKVLKKDIGNWMKEWGYPVPDEEDGRLWFADNRFYDSENEYGAYYEIENITWNGLSEKVSKEFPYICLFVDNKRSSAFRSWLKRSETDLQKRASTIKEKGIEVVVGKAGWPNYLAIMNLSVPLNIEVLTREPIQLIKRRLAEKLKVFTKTLTGKGGLIKPLYPV